MAGSARLRFAVAGFVLDYVGYKWFIRAEFETKSRTKPGGADRYELVPGPTFLHVEAAPDSGLGGVSSNRAHRSSSSRSYAASSSVSCWRRSTPHRTHGDMTSARRPNSGARSNGRSLHRSTARHVGPGSSEVGRPSRDCESGTHGTRYRHNGRRPSRRWRIP